VREGGGEKGSQNKNTENSTAHLAYSNIAIEMFDRVAKNLALVG
jgi:hypothetical protein